MNKKLVESYIKDRLRKQFGRGVTCENGIAYISTLVEVDFGETEIHIYGYKTQEVIVLGYPRKDDDTASLRLLFCIIMAQHNVEGLYYVYNEEDS